LLCPHSLHQHRRPGVHFPSAAAFLEVNTRLQVEHPVTEEVTGIDLVREMFRLAEGAELGYDDPPSRGHAFEFRVNAEDPGRGFLPVAGTLSEWVPPTGPGVRLDSGYAAGATVPQDFDSLIAKLIVTGATRQQGIERARRALAEFVAEGIPTVLPFHRAVLMDTAFVTEPFSVHTQWIENEFDNRIPRFGGATDPGVDQTVTSERVTVEIGRRRLEVVLRSDRGATAAERSRDVGIRPKSRPEWKSRMVAVGGDALVSPMQGTIVKIVVNDGATVATGETIAILEAMKMEQPLPAHRAGTVTGLSIKVGDAVASGTVLCEIKD
jgi:acetyl-CoA/propionyl-CoA carboxylase, biotin carboxylase, biotin carboxyl carrier protein